VHPFKASIWAQPRLCAQTVPRPCSGHSSPVQTLTAAELEPTPCNFSSALKVVAVKSS
jgi:hypothetical protein